MALQSIKYTPGQLEILDQLLLPVQSKYVNVKGVEDGWHVINKMQVSIPVAAVFPKPPSLFVTKPTNHLSTI